MARTTERYEIIKPLLSVILAGAVMDMYLSIITTAQAATLAVPTMDPLL